MITNVTVTVCHGYVHTGHKGDTWLIHVTMYKPFYLFVDFFNINLEVIYVSVLFEHLQHILTIP